MSPQTVALPNLPPPVDLASYSKSMLMHTKRQMEATNVGSPRRSGRGRGSPVPSMPNGTSSTSSTSPGRSNSIHEYHD
ncbi:hypothetical protein F4780DRAFT_725499 [Xylariomycetidae sp. FL0641]|nr:hypothetical protein F4780DRAFT_725499 [Xylariomycetidae sp. FL0641]